MATWQIRTIVGIIYLPTLVNRWYPQLPVQPSPLTEHNIKFLPK